MAVDVRAEDIPAVKKRIKSQVLRLFAAMLGCPYDALAMREQHRKRQRFAAIMSVILAIAVGFSTVLLVKNHQIDRKNAELDSANTALEAKNEELDKKNSELDQKNEELEEKNSEVLMRESELLTSNSEEAYKEGDNYTAISSAATALPTENDPRPYYAPAEAALLTALSPFDGEDGYIMRDTVLEQSTPVENFRISADGTKLATIDLYSVITIFDTVTGEVLNTIQLNTDTVYSFTNVHLLYCPESDCVIAFDGKTIAAISFETCDILWSHSTPYAQTDFICPSSDGILFAYMRSAYDEEDGCTDYELVFLSGATGEIVSTSKFIDSSLYNKDNYKRTAFKGQVAQGMYNGRFSSDNSRFATTFFSEDDNNTYTLNYSVTDIAAGTSKVVCSFEVDSYYISHSTYFLYFDTEDTIVSVRQTSESDHLMQAERVDINSGRILWHTLLPKTALTVPVGETDSVFCFTSGVDSSLAYIILSDSMYMLDSTTGELQASLKLPGKVVDADVANGSFVYVMEDGHYSRAILSSYGISDVGDAVDLGDTFRMRVWNGGPTALSGADSESDAGYLATIPTDNTRSVVIKRVSLIADLFPYEPLDITGDAYYSSNNPFQLKDGTLAFGPFFKDSAYSFKIINPDTGELLKEFPIETGYGIECMRFLPDGTGIVYTDYYGDVTLYKEDGSSEMLYDTEYTFISFGDTMICEIPALSDSATLSESGDVLTAVCTEDSLLLWTNAKNKKELPLPEDLNWLYFDGHTATLLMDVSPDGRIFISDFTDEDPFIDRFAVYSTVTGTWSYLDLGDINLAVGFICFSENSSDFVLLDDDGNILMFDASGKISSEFSLQLPSNSVTQMELILDDAFLMVKTTDLQVLVYNVSTGELVYRETDVSTSSTLLYPYHDRVNNRLYLASGSTSTSVAGLCIDIGSWTTLSRINGLIYFNEDTLEMYRIVYLKGLYATDIAHQTLPPTKTLAALAREFLGV